MRYQLESMRHLLLSLLPALLFAQGPCGDGASSFIDGMARHTAGEYDAAIRAFEQSIANEYQTPAARFRIGRAYAKQGAPEKAIEWLWQAARSEFSNLQILQTDPDLASLRQLPEFEKIVALVTLNTKPCPQRPTRKQFLFWVGEWEARNKAGQKTGESSIVLHESGCTVVENWRGANGTTGQSLNFYNPHTARWNQTWVGANGLLTYFTGEWQNGSMVFVATQFNGPNKISQRMTFTPNADGSFRQFGEASTNSGTTWTPSWDFTYVRKKP